MMIILRDGISQDLLFEVKYNDKLKSTIDPVADFSIVCFLLSIAKQKNKNVHQVDYIIVFFYSTLNHELYMTMTDLRNEGCISIMCKLIRTLYGLKVSPRVWYELLSKRLEELGQKPMKSSVCFFEKEICRSFALLMIC